MDYWAQFQKYQKFLNRREMSKEVVEKLCSGNYSRGVPTAIGGTLNRFGDNVYWHLYADTLSELPVPERFDIKALVAGERAVYDATPDGWVRNDEDTTFIGGDVSYSVGQIIDSKHPRVITVCRDLNSKTGITIKTYKRFLRSLVKNGAVLSRPEYVHANLDAGAKIVVIELNSDHNRATSITTVKYDKPTDYKKPPVWAQFNSFAALLVSRKSITIYRHRFLATGARVVI